MSETSERLVEALQRWSELGEVDAAGAALDLLCAAEGLLEGGRDGLAQLRPACHDYLELTGRPAFLGALAGPPERLRWAETAFALVRHSDYRLEDMLRRRAEEIGEQPLFEELSQLRLDSTGSTRSAEGGGATPAWTYDRVRRRARAIAALFLELAPAPRVALYLDNSVDGACCDLACLLHDILVTPLSTNIDAGDLTWILDRLGINVVVTDREERVRRLLEVRERVAVPFTLLSVRPGRSVERGDARQVAGELAHLLPARIDELLEARPRRALDEVCTVMFTSGSTGRPKGVAFSAYHLISKRFGRAAALPGVGTEEKLLCYLPLFHTFGRYLEMLGALFWRGTYVFAGNPSAETLFAGLRLVRPTGLISIPLRWAQLRERVLRAADEPTGSVEQSVRLDSAVAEITGGRLRWGLSAAGYLDPRAFRFFQAHGIALCSGFGMTEGTGGLTMSPPDEYLDGTVGVPLPGVRVRFTEEGELLIGGEYVAGYLREEGSGLELEPPLTLDGLPWLATGDIFQTLEDGHLAIVDRIKDIYKNSRGQTIAPRRVEREFEGVPGIRRTFLVGDRRPHNTLLIAPDTSDVVLASLPDQQSRDEYFHQIVSAANGRLAGFERVVRYALLDRDFQAERGELTPKGSFRRRAIEENFADVIEDLYRERKVQLRLEALRVVIPHWIYRDLGILEDDIVVTAGGLRDRRRSLDLPIHARASEAGVEIGDLVYVLEGELLDLGILARQPRLWIGNPALIRFLNCKDGWDVDLGPMNGQVLRPARRGAAAHEGLSVVDPTGIDDPQLVQCNRLVQETLFANEDVAQRALAELSSQMGQYDPRLDVAVRQRLKALAGHASQKLRCQAYRVLLTDRPAYGYDEAFGAFIRSGLPFLDEESIQAIASGHLGLRRLDALRQRLHRYRHELDWPADEGVRRQFEDVLKLLTDFVRYHPTCFKPVRSELACWILHRADPELARFAEQRMREMVTRFELELEEEDETRGRRLHPEQVAFDEDVAAEHRERLLALLCGTSFLRHSLMVTANEWEFDPRQVPAEGTWISPQPSAGRFTNFRVSINTNLGRHFALLVVLGLDVDVQRVRDTTYHMMKIAGHPFEPRAIPRVGALRPERAALSLEFVDEPNLEERIRHYASVRASHRQALEPVDWRRLFVRAIAGVFRAWSYGGQRIVPGAVRPSNVVVPELDSKPHCFLVSLGGWRPYRGPLDLFRPLVVSFYRRTLAHHPVCQGILSLDWVFDGCLEGLPEGDGLTLLKRLKSELEDVESGDPVACLASPLESYLVALQGRYRVPLLLQTAIDRFLRWHRLNPEATAAAQIDEVENLIRLYQLDQRNELVRYHFFRHTVFARRSARALECFDRLLAALATQPGRPATERVELSDLQDALGGREERECFGRMVFPRALSPASAEADVLAVDASGQKRIALRTWITDRQGGRYGVREPLDAEEVGHAYRLFLREHYPLRVSELDRQLLALDDAERVIAALVYHFQETEVVHLSGMVVAASLTSRGIATALLDDFLDRMSNRGAKVVKTGFMLHVFGRRRGFTVDPRWGGLVRFIGDEPEPDSAE